MRSWETVTGYSPYAPLIPSLVWIADYLSGTTTRAPVSFTMLPLVSRMFIFSSLDIARIILPRFADSVDVIEVLSGFT